VAGALALAACSTPTKVDHGAIHGSTFNFVNPGQRPQASFVDETQVAHKYIQDAITKNLANRGVTKVGSGGDLTVAYLLIIGNNVSTMSVNDYFGYGRDSDELHEKAQSAYSSSKNPNSFEAGTLLIDIIDSKTFKLLKRGYTTRSILRDPSSEVRATRVQEAVDEILRDVQIEH
jgi:hypothetical protein